MSSPAILVKPIGSSALPHRDTPKLTTPTSSQMSWFPSASLARGPPLSPLQVDWPACMLRKVKLLFVTAEPSPCLM